MEVRQIELENDFFFFHNKKTKFFWGERDGGKAFICSIYKVYL